MEMTQKVGSVKLDEILRPFQWKQRKWAWQLEGQWPLKWKIVCDIQWCNEFHKWNVGCPHTQLSDNVQSETWNALTWTWKIEGCQKEQTQKQKTCIHENNDNQKKRRIGKWSPSWKSKPQRHKDHNDTRKTCIVNWRSRGDEWLKMGKAGHCWNQKMTKIAKTQERQSQDSGEMKWKQNHPQKWTKMANVEIRK